MGPSPCSKHFKDDNNLMLINCDVPILQMSMCCAVLSNSVMSDSLCPMDCSQSGASVHGDSLGKKTGMG